MAWTSLLYRGAAYLWGWTTLLILTIRAYLDQDTWRIFQKVTSQQISEASNQLWDLSESSSGRIHHNLITVQNGIQLHYLSSFPSSHRSKHLTIFLHGFPDSGQIFRAFLNSEKLRNTQTQMVALDLPGYGGSDSLPIYDAKTVLNAIIEAIVVLKGLYLQDNSLVSRCTVVGHDWGAIILARIAANTTGLIWRAIIVNGAYMPLVRRKATEITQRSRNALRKRSMQLARSEFQPLLVQILKSGYIFMFNLPMPLLKVWPWTDQNFNHFLRWMWIHGHHSKSQDPINEAERLAVSRASSCGPTTDQCTSHLADGTSYGPSVLSRAATSPPGDWLNRIRLYREGLATAEWRFDVKLAKYEAVDRAIDHHFKCPTTIIFGMKDVALDPRIMFDGMMSYLSDSKRLEYLHDMYKTGEWTMGRSTSSHMLALRECGHWSVLEEDGKNAVEAFLLWTIASGADVQPDGRLASDKVQNAGDGVRDVSLFLREAGVENRTGEAQLTVLH